MIQMDAIWRQAQADLTVRTEHNEPDSFLWEHAARVARSVGLLIQQIGRDDAELDRDVLTAAALYQASGWVVQYQAGVLRRSEFLGRSLTDLQRELAAAHTETALCPLVPSRRLAEVCHLIRNAGRRGSAGNATHILSDAVNLDTIGPLLLWQQVRRLSAAGCGVDAMLDIWRRQREYAFWDARVKDAFHFEAVQTIARRRLEILSAFMAGLESHVDGEDICRLLDPRQAMGASHDAARAPSAPRAG